MLMTDQVYFNGSHKMRYANEMVQNKWSKGNPFFPFFAVKKRSSLQKRYKVKVNLEQIPMKTFQYSPDVQLDGITCFVGEKKTKKQIKLDQMLPSQRAVCQLCSRASSGCLLAGTLKLRCKEKGNPKAEKVNRVRRKDGDAFRDLPLEAAPSHEPA